jgi:CRP-like cAMP-binding protein
MVILPNERELLEKRLMELDAQLKNIDGPDSDSPVLERANLRITLSREYIELANRLQDLKASLDQQARDRNRLGEGSAVTEPGAVRNRLLARLSAGDRERLLSRMQRVDLRFKQVLYRYQAPIDYVYFPNRGTASALAIMNDGRAIELVQIGNEGLVGASALLCENVSPSEIVIQLAGDAWRIRTETLRNEIRHDGPLRELLLRYHAALTIQISQSVACNGLHSVQERCCRWLLMTHDRMESDTFPLTHEFLGIMLGVRRSSISEVLHPLGQQGLIRSKRGEITILDRAGLERKSCECYRKVTEEFHRLLV